jgi:hypothetical protein
MPSLLWVREYVKATNLVSQRAHSERKSRAKQLCRKSNGAIVVWLKSKNERWTSNNITAHLLISDCSTVTLRGPGPRLRIAKRIIEFAKTGERNPLYCVKAC